MLKILLTIACILSAAFFFIYQSTKISNVTHGFTSYYTFSRLLIEEKDFSRSYDTAYFNSKIKEFGIEEVKDLPNNVPTSSILFLPLAKLEPRTAKIVWTVFSTLAYFLSILILLKIFNHKITDNKGLALILISLLFLPVYHELTLGQIYVFLLLLFSISIYGIKNNNKLQTSVPIALILVIKGYGIFLLVGLAALKKWKELLITIGLVLALILITLPFIGTWAWAYYFSNVLFGVTGNPFASSTAYQTLNSLLLNIMPGLATVILTIIALALLAIFIIRVPHSERGKLFFYSSIIIMNVILAPVAEDYHYTLILPSVFAAGVILFDSYKLYKLESVLFIITIILLSFPFNYKNLNDAAFPLILLAYPRLYAGMLIILLYLLPIKKQIPHHGGLRRKALP